MPEMGLYIHIPFCVRKCPYCDFYSLPATEEALESYTASLLTAMERWAQRLPDHRAETLYFGGGTPSLLGGDRLSRLIRQAEACFHLFSGATPEITLEANPADDLADTLAAFAAAGGIGCLWECSPPIRRSWRCLAVGIPPRTWSAPWRMPVGWDCTTCPWT